MIVGQFLASASMASQLRIGPNGETRALRVPRRVLAGGLPVRPDCISMTRDPQSACAYGAYCNATSYEDALPELPREPWVYSNATRYSSIIHTAINSRTGR
jgi:hypothetical protein